MVQELIKDVSIKTKANVFFDGKCISHAITLADGTKKSVGVILGAALTFNTEAPEIMECVAGECNYKLAGSTEWHTSKPGESFQIPGNSSFEIKVGQEYHYICHFG
jgi:uncharacterized protein YaiE (UPF0345 family)